MLDFFGKITIALLVFFNLSYGVYLFSINDLTTYNLFSVIFGGAPPLIISYMLWHTKSKNEELKDKAYTDLANQLNKESGKSDIVIQAISDGVIAVNNQGIIELINPAAQHIVGWGHQDALNLDYKSVLQLLTKDSHEVDKAADPVFNVLSTNQPVRRNDLQIQTNAGKKVAINIVVSPIGRLGSGAIIVFHDITKEQAEEAAQAEFISTASHEMRTPVASIEGYLGLALNPNTATVDAKAREFIDKAHQGAQHLGRLLQDLLDVTKADDGRLSNNPKVIEMISFTKDILEGLRPKADEKKLRLFFKPDMADGAAGMKSVEPVFYVNLDADHLREILANLIENAIKYTPAGEVIVDIKGDDNHIVVSIADSGIGIPIEDIPHLFQKFYRVDNSDTREIGGTGLGLYLCRRLIEGMGGRIWVDSEYKKGSTFSVELPRISYEEATHLIENAKSTITDVSQKKYLNSDSPGDLSTTEVSEALSTPIVTSHATPAEAPPQAQVQTQAEVQDPLMGVAPTTPAEAQTPTVSHNPMVVPASVQQVISTPQVASPTAPIRTGDAQVSVPKRP